MSKLTKITRISKIPGSPGIPGTPGTPATPGYWETIPGSVQASPPDASWYFDESTGKWIVVTPKSGEWSSAPTQTQRWVPPRPAVPPTPGTAPVPAQILRDLNVGWNAGAVSKFSISGDCTLLLRISPSSVGVVAGLNSLNEGSGYAEIDHGVYCSSGLVRAFERGAIVGPTFGFVAADEISIKRSGESVQYLKNGVVFYTSAIASVGAVFADASLYAGGDEILATEFTGLASCVSVIAPLVNLSADAAYAGAVSALAPLASTGTQYTPADATSTLTPLRTISASGAYAAANSTLPAISCSSSSGEMEPPIHAVVSFLPCLASYSQGVEGCVADTASTLAPLRSLSASGSYNEATSTIQELKSLCAQLPPIGNYAALGMPAGAVRGFGRSSGAGKPIVMAFSAKARGGSNAALTGPSPTTSGSASTVFKAGAALVMPAGAVGGTASTIALAGAVLTIPGFRASGNSGASARLAIPGFGVLAVSSWVQASRAALAMPMFGVLATASMHAANGGALVMPAPYLHRGASAALTMPAAFVVASGSVALMATFEAYSVNLLHSGAAPQVDEVTRYTNFPFTQIVRFQGDYFGVAADGLYKLGGATDDGEAIAFSFKTCPSDFEAPELKTVASAYLAGRIGPDSTIALFAGESASQQYAHSTPRGQTAQTHRQKFGRGIKDRYFSIGVSGEDVFSLDSVELEINKLSRRI